MQLAIYDGLEVVHVPIDKVVLHTNGSIEVAVHGIDVTCLLTPLVRLVSNIELSE